MRALNVVVAMLVSVLAWPLVAATATPADAATSVYLMRGLMDVSTGLDDLAGRLKRRGVKAKVASYTARDELSAAAIRDFKSGRGCPIVIVGHSLGADAAIDMAETLKQAGVPVALLVAFSPAYPRSVPGNVRQAVNYYQSDSVWNNRYTARAGGKAVVRNVDLAKDGSIHHFNIEKAARLQAETLRLIGSAHSACGSPATR